MQYIGYYDFANEFKCRCSLTEKKKARMQNINKFNLKYNEEII